VDLLILANLVDFFDVDSLEAAQDTPGPSKTKKLAEVQDIDNTFVRTTSISLDEEDDGEDKEGA